MEAKVIQCTACSNRMKITPAHFGKKIRCTKCQSVLVIGATGDVEKVVQATARTGAQGQPAKGASKAPAPASKKSATHAPKTAKLVSSKQPARKGDSSAPGARAAAGKSTPPAAKKAAKQDSTPPRTGKKAKKGKEPAKKELKPAQSPAAKGDMKPAGSVAGKAELKPAKAAKKKAPKKVASRILKKAAGIKRASAKDRAEMLDYDKGSRRIWMLAAAVLLLGCIGTIVWWFMQPADPPPPAPADVPLALEVKMEKVRTVPVRVVTIDGSPEYQIDIYERSTDGMEFVLIPGGTYTVGSPTQDSERAEVPEQQVTVEEFYIGRNEITNGEYRRFTQYLFDLRKAQFEFEQEADTWNDRQPDYARRMRERADRHDPSAYDHPLQPLDKSTHDPTDFGLRDDARVCWGLDWWDAWAYQNWANGMDTNRGILPTEIEWEIAARGRSGFLYPWGNTEADLQEAKNRYGDAEEREMSIGDFLYKRYGYGAVEADAIPDDLLPVNEMPANSFGLVNVCGNAAEYCWDRYARRLYQYTEQSGQAWFGPEPSRSNFDDFRAADNHRALRLSSVALSGLDELRYTRRRGEPLLKQRESERYVTFRCVYYPEGRDPVYAAEIEAHMAANPDNDEVETGERWFATDE